MRWPPLRSSRIQVPESVVLNVSLWMLFSCRSELGGPVVEFTGDTDRKPVTAAQVAPLDIFFFGYFFSNLTITQVEASQDKN